MLFALDVAAAGAVGAASQRKGIAWMWRLTGCSICVSGSPSPVLSHDGRARHQAARWADCRGGEGGLDKLRVSPRGDNPRQDGCRAGPRPGADWRSQ